jgi:hypothetical protein
MKYQFISGISRGTDTKTPVFSRMSSAAPAALSWDAMDDVDKELIAITFTSLVYYQLYPIMLLIGFPAIPPALIYKVVSPDVVALLNDYMIMVFNKTTRLEDLRKDHLSPEFMRCSEQIYEQLCQNVAAAAPSEVGEMYADFLGLQTGGGYGSRKINIGTDIFDRLFKGQSGGGGGGAPNGENAPQGARRRGAAPPAAAAPGYRVEEPGAPAAAAVPGAGVGALIAPGAQFPAARYAGAAGAFEQRQAGVLANLGADSETLETLRGILGSLLEDLRADMDKLRRDDYTESKYPLSKHGKRLQIALTATTSKSTIGTQISGNIAKQRPCATPCWMVASAFSGKCVVPCVVAGSLLANNEAFVSKVKVTMGLPEVIVPTATPSMMAWVSGGVSTAVQTVLEVPLGLVSGIFGGVGGALGSATGIPAIPFNCCCLGGTAVASAACYCCVTTTFEACKARGAILKTMDAETRFLKRMATDATLAGLRNIEGVLSEYVAMVQSGLLEGEFAARYVEGVSSLPVDKRTNANYLAGMRAINAKRPVVSAAERTRLEHILVFRLKAGKHADALFDEQFREWTGKDFTGLIGGLSKNIPATYDLLLGDISRATQDLNRTLGGFEAKLKAIADAPANAAAAAAGRAASVTLLIGSAIPALAPAALAARAAAGALGDRAPPPAVRARAADQIENGVIPLMEAMGDAPPLRLHAGEAPRAPIGGAGAPRLPQIGYAPPAAAAPPPLPQLGYGPPGGAAAPPYPGGYPGGYPGYPPPYGGPYGYGPPPPFPGYGQPFQFGAQIPRFNGAQPPAAAAPAAPAARAPQGGRLALGNGNVENAAAAAERGGRRRQTRKAKAQRKQKQRQGRSTRQRR